MESWTIPIEYKNSPFDKSIESIESTKVYGALLLRRYYLSLANEIEYKNSPFDKSIESIKSTKVYGAVLLSRYYLSLANEMQQSNGKLEFSDRI